jgi:hypothetical protein
MVELSIDATGVIFRNPLPGHRVTNAFYPFIHVMDDGELLCVLRIGMLEIFRSADRGESWERQGPIVDRARDGGRYNYVTACVTTLSDGGLVMMAMRADQSDPDKLAYNPETQGLLPLETCYLASSDGGRAWTDPQVVDTAAHFGPEFAPAPYGGVVELESGEWFQAYETWKSYDNDGPFNLNVFGLISNDRGRTWPEKVTIADGAPAGRSYSHVSPVKGSAGRLVGTAWTAESQLQKYFGLSLIRSTDPSARIWDTPELIGVPGQTSTVAPLGKRLLLIYSHREETDEPGLKVVYSEDDGRTWTLDNPLTVWDAYGREALGVPRSSTYPSSHDAIAYGAPRMVALDDQTAVACWWCTLGADTHCRWARIRVEDSP